MKRTYQQEVRYKLYVSWDSRAVASGEGKEGVLRMNAIQKNTKGMHFANVYGICFPFTLGAAGSPTYDLSKNFFYGSLWGLQQNYRSRRIPSHLSIETFKDRSFTHQGLLETKEERGCFYLLPPAQNATLEQTLQVGSSQAHLMRFLREQAKSVLPSIHEKLTLVRDFSPPHESMIASFVDFPAALLAKAQSQGGFYKARNDKDAEKAITVTLRNARFVSVPTGGQPR